MGPSDMELHMILKKDQIILHFVYVKILSEILTIDHIYYHDMIQTA